MKYVEMQCIKTVKMECVKIAKMECMKNFNNGLYEICKNVVFENGKT